jgi:hypothetical protein
MDFPDFQQTKRQMPDGKLCYLNDELFIEQLEGLNEHLLVIGNQSYESTDLESLELVLYYWCCGESYFGDELQQREILRDNAIYFCAAVDPNGTYRDIDCIADGIDPIGFNEALSQVVSLTSTK